MVERFAKERVREAVNTLLNVDFINDDKAKERAHEAQTVARVYGVITRLPAMMKGELETGEEEPEEETLPEDPDDL